MISWSICFDLTWLNGRLPQNGYLLGLKLLFTSFYFSSTKKDKSKRFWEIVLNMDKFISNFQLEENYVGFKLG